jgi:capsular exopolysaccharide synthesis family protein
MRVSAESSDKVKARKMAAAVADAFVRYHTLRRMEISNDVFLYLQKQKEREEESLRSAEQRLQEFREETQISSLDATDSDHPVLKRLTLLNEQLTQTELQTIELESEIRVVKEAVQHGGRTLQPENEQLFSMPSIRDDATVMSVREALVSANEELARLQDVYGPEHPRYQSAKGTLDMLRERLTSALGEITGSLEARLAAFENKENKLRSEYEEQQTLAMDLARQSLAFSHLQNEVERHRKLYEVLVARMSEVELTSDYTRTNVEVVEEAALPKNPVRPNKRRMATTSLILGLIVGLGLAFVVEHVDDTVRTPDDLEVRVGIPVLGFVPRIEMKGKENEGASYRALICAKEPTSSAIEAYRNIRTAIFFSIPAEEAKILLVTSGGPAAGKTTTAANLATIIAQSGKRVLLVDADFRRPMVHHIFGLSQERGLSSVLVGEAGFDESVQKSMENLEVLENLDLLSSGPKPANPTELLETRSMRKFLAAMREKYDRVIIDLPPVLFVSDAAILGAQADGVVLVVRSGKSTCAHASRARKQIEKVKGRIIGGILNDVKVTRLGHYYSDYFYHGYSRYYHDYYSSYYGQSRDRKEGRPRSSRKKKEEEAAV